MTATRKLIGYPFPGWLLGVLLLAGVTACTGRFLAPPPGADDISGPGFVVVTPRAGDTFADLARTYLGNHRKSWIIAAYNQLDAPQPGRRVVIPLAPVALGGLTPEGYQSVPVLYYPGIGPDMEMAPQDRQTLSAAAFTTQLQWLKDNGFVTVSLDQLRLFLHFQDQLPPRSVVLSFDTGQRWPYDIVFPILQRFGYTAALFVPTRSIDQPDAMSWSELALLAAAGFDIGTSGRSSQSLTRKPENRKVEEWLNEVAAELAAAAEIIATQLGNPCRYFAYPEGDTNDLLVALLKRHGYVSAFTRRPGGNPFFADDYRLSRTTIESARDWEQFKDQLTVFQAADLR